MTDLPSRPHDGQIACFDTWVNKATSWIGGTNALCVDAQDRICRIGKDFMRARDEGALPVRFWHGEGPETPRQQQRSIRAARATMKLNYPWRY